MIRIDMVMVRILVINWECGRFPTPHIIFNLNILGIGLFLYLNWYYAGKKSFIDESVDLAKITIIKRVNLAFIIVILLAIVATFISPQ